jgi:hypothetical protein
VCSHHFFFSVNKFISLQEYGGQTPNTCVFCNEFRLNSGKKVLSLCTEHLKEIQTKDGIKCIQPYKQNQNGEPEESSSEDMDEDLDADADEDEDEDQSGVGLIECGHCDFKASSIAAMTVHMKEHQSSRSPASQTVDGEEKGGKVLEEVNLSEGPGGGLQETPRKKRKKRRERVQDIPNKEEKMEYPKEQEMKFPGEDYLQELTGTVQPFGTPTKKKQTARKTFFSRRKRKKPVASKTSKTQPCDLSLEELLTTPSPSKPKKKAPKRPKTSSPNLLTTPPALEFGAMYEDEIAPALERSKCEILQRAQSVGKKPCVVNAPVKVKDIAKELEGFRCPLVQTELKCSLQSGLTPAAEVYSTSLATEIIPSLQPEKSLDGDVSFSITKILHSKQSVCDLPCHSSNTRHLLFFPSLSELSQHILVAHHPYGRVHTCSECTFSCTSAKVFQLHHKAMHLGRKRQHSELHLIKCCVCALTADSVSAFNDHFDAKHPSEVKPVLDTASREIQSARELLTLCCDLTVESSGEDSMPILTKYNDEEDDDDDPKLRMTAVVMLEDVINVLLEGF